MLERECTSGNKSMSSLLRRCERRFVTEGEKKNKKKKKNQAAQTNKIQQQDKQREVFLRFFLLNLSF